MKRLDRESRGCGWLHQNDPEKCSFVLSAPFERRQTPCPPAATVRALKGQPKGAHRDTRPEPEVTVRWLHVAVHLTERQQRPCGDAGTGGGTDASSSDAAEEKME